MTLHHDEFDRRIAEADDLNNLDADLDAHATECERCQSRLDLARRIRATSPQLIEHNDNDVDDTIEAVLSRTHPRSSRLPKLLAAAAAVAVFAGGASFVLRASPSETDVLDSIATEYSTSDGIRFVLSTEATIDLSDDLANGPTTSEDLVALGSQIPTCDDSDPNETASTDTTESGALVDLGPIVEAIATTDPCLALDLIGESARPAVEAFDTLARSVNERQTGIDRLLTDDDTSDLVEASANALIDDQRGEIETAEQALSNLRESFTQLAETVQPLATSDPASFAVSTVQTDLIALQTDLTAAVDATTAVDAVVEWTQIATGTWMPDGVAVEGVTERADTSIQYSGVDNDPLGLADTVLERPQILLDLLRSAPASTDTEITWTVPDGVLNGDLTWEATARIDGEQLRELSLRSRDVTIVLTPAR
jgi:hypothetical protein